MWGKTLPLRELLGLVGRFPGKTTPAALPDITEHNNCMTDFFKANPDVYAKLKDKVRP